MKEAEENFLHVVSDVHLRSEEILRIKIDILNVIYACIGSGAGWATKVNRRRTILYGL